MYKIIIYTLVNLISITILTAIPYLFICFINMEWQNFREWDINSRACYGMIQVGIYMILLPVNICVNEYLNDK